MRRKKIRGWKGLLKQDKTKPWAERPNIKKLKKACKRVANKVKFKDRASKGKLRITSRLRTAEEQIKLIMNS